MRPDLAFPLADSFSELLSNSQIPQDCITCSAMHLTQKEEKFLAGESGEAMRTAYRVLVALGRLTKASRLIPIKWAHVSGVSYLTIGDYGLDFLRRLSRQKEAKFRVFTTVNPCGMDIEKWDTMNIPTDYAEKQLQIISSYERLGIANSYTCVPFQSYSIPSAGTHVAWAESSAAIYANSILGLMSNRESAVSALASALSGKTVYSDLHLEENRRPVMNIRVGFSKRNGLHGSLDYGLLGYFAGGVTSGVIGFQNVRKPKLIEEAKALCAAIGTTGSSGMFVFGSRERIETVDFGDKEYDETLDTLSDKSEGEAIIFGCPQMTVEELYELSKLVKGRKLKKKCIVFCSSKVYGLAKTRGYVEVIEGAGATFVRDACADFTPLISELNVDSVETDSCKGAHYMKRVHNIKIAVRNTSDIIRAAT
jgi:predicted aconitase